MSDNDKCHFADTKAEWHYGKQRLKRCVLRRLRKTARDGADVMWCGKLFQTWAAVTGNSEHSLTQSVCSVGCIISALGCIISVFAALWCEIHHMYLYLWWFRLLQLLLYSEPLAGSKLLCSSTNNEAVW